MEVDFPRGGAYNGKKAKAKQGLKKKQRKKTTSLTNPAQEINSNSKETNEEKSKSWLTWSVVSSKKLFVKGAHGLGFVKEIHDVNVRLECFDGVFVNLPISNIGGKLIERMKSSEIESLNAFFTIGQALAFRVVNDISEISENGRQKLRPTVSIDPFIVNRHLVPAVLKKGVVLNGLIESIEEKGIIINLGLRLTEVRGFLPISNLPLTFQEKRPFVGQVILVQLCDHFSEKRIIKLTAIPQALSDKENEDLIDISINELMPGTIIRVKVLYSNSHGLIVEIDEGKKIFIAKRHLPPKLRSLAQWNVEKISFVIMFRQGINQISILNGHPVILALSDCERRTSLKGIKIGDFIECKVLKIFRDCLELGYVHEDEHSSSLTIIAKRKMLESDNYAKQSVHKMRVFSTLTVERQIFVTNKKDLMAQKFISIQDAVVGESVSATIIRANKFGVNVKIYNSILGFIPSILLSDRPVISIKRRFTVGQTLECRILHVNPSRRKLILTSKISLVKANDQVISDYKKENIGSIATGFVHSLQESGGIVVKFYNDVRAFMKAKEADRLGGDIKVGFVLQVKIKDVDPEAKTMLVVLADPTINAGNSVPRWNPFQSMEESPSSPFPSGIVQRETYQKIASEVYKQLEVVIRITKKQKLEALVPVELLSDNLDLPFDYSVMCVKSGAKIDEIAILGELNGLIKATPKRFVIDWLKRYPVINSFEQLSVGTIVCGTVIKLLDEKSCFIELVGGSALVGIGHFPKLNILDNLFGSVIIGQTVIGKITSVYPERKQFYLTLNPKYSYPMTETDDKTSLGLCLLKSSIEEIEWLSKNNVKKISLPKLGSYLYVKLIEVRTEGLFVMADDDLFGFVYPGNFSPLKLELDQTLITIVLDINFPSCLLILRIVDQLESEFIGKTGGIQMEKIISGKVSLVKRDFTVVVTNDPVHAIYLPSRFHPNQVPSSGRFEVGENINVFPKLAIGAAILGLYEKDDAEQFSYYSRYKSEANSKKLKTFKVYKVKVVGFWNYNGLSHATAELRFQNGDIGRLHASELNERDLKKSLCPMKTFIEENLNKYVHVKIISMHKMKIEISQSVTAENSSSKMPKKPSLPMKKLSRVADCTMSVDKINETKKKLSLLGYPQRYIHGSVVNVFVKGVSKQGILHVEVSPIWSGIIRKQNLVHPLMMIGEEQKSLFEMNLKGGEMLAARIIGVNMANGKSMRRHRKSLELTLTDINMRYVAEQRIAARVVKVEMSPICITFELPNLQRAILTSTCITDRYDCIFKYIKVFKVNEVSYIYLIRYDENTGNWLAVTEERFKSIHSNEVSRGHSGLLQKVSDVKEKAVLKAFITSVVEGKIYAEIGPGLIGPVKKKKIVTDLKVNEIITARVLEIFSDGSIKLLYMGKVAFIVDNETDGTIIVGNSVDNEVNPSSRKRKRKISKNSLLIDPEKKSVAAGYSNFIDNNREPRIQSVKIGDPGFDWSLKGYSMSDFAAVGHLQEAESSPTKKREQRVGDLDVQNAKRKKYDPNYEVNVEKELIDKERRILSEDYMPESIGDFERLVAGNPNFAELWIRYISFFVEKKNIANARLAAERALQTINYRKENELFNVWTAYLNMEVLFGDDNSVDNVFERAVKNTDSLKMYKQMIKIQQKVENVEKVDSLFVTMLKKFRHDDLNVWLEYAKHLFVTSREVQARNLLKKALVSLNKNNHVNLLYRFALLEFKYGDMEQGKTIFENILNSYPKRTDVWTVYVDAIVKSGKPDEIRNLFERVTAMSFPVHKMRLFYKKWVEVEERLGNSERQKRVKQSAIEYAGNMLKE